MKIYVVTMYRWGDRENHSYVLGAYSDDIDIALLEASNEKQRRGGNKYYPEILCFDNATEHLSQTTILGLDDSSYVVDSSEESQEDPPVELSA